MIIATRRWQARGGTADSLEMVVVVAVPCGIVGARIYHVITDYQLYFGPGRHPIDALKIWHGGLGDLGGGRRWRARRLPGGAPAQDRLPGAAGRGRPGHPGRAGDRPARQLVQPGAVRAADHPARGRWRSSRGTARPATQQFATFHPTFLYELLWNLAVAVVLVLLDRKFRLGHGKVFALYVMLYCAGRFWIEALRIDTVNEIGGFRLNNYTSLIVFLAALVWFVWLVRNRPGREEVVEGDPPGARIRGRRVRRRTD